jgi:diguanylate cyclase (GGDEF)-like protein
VPCTTLPNAGASARRRRQLSLELDALRQAVHEQYVEDKLTGVYPAAVCLRFGQHVVWIANRQGIFLQVLLADLVNLAAISAQYGRHNGDLALMDAAGLLQRSFRQADIVGRLDTVRFVVLAVAAAPGSGPVLAARVQIAVKAHAAHGHRRYTLDLAVATAAYEPTVPCSFAELVERAAGRLGGGPGRPT